MAIQLTKPIRRQMLSSAATSGKHRGKPVIVELLPGDEISFRIKGTKMKYSIYLGHCFRLAQIQTVETNYRKAMETYQAKKKAGYKRLHKPKRSSLPFNSIYFKALEK